MYSVFADGYEDACPKGFTLDTTSYCAGMLCLFFNTSIIFNTIYLNICDCSILLLSSNAFLLDEDECALQSPCSHSCNNIMGGFSCTCPSGFTISADTNVCQGKTKKTCWVIFFFCNIQYYNTQCTEIMSYLSKSKMISLTVSLMQISMNVPKAHTCATTTSSVSTQWERIAARPSVDQDLRPASQEPAVKASSC